MKKLFNVTIGGYYLCSMVLGFAMAVTVCMAVCDTWNYAYSRVMILEDVVREEYGGRYAFSREGSVIKAGPISEEAEVAWSKVESKSDFLDDIWLYMPTESLYDALYVGHGHTYVPIVLVLSGAVTVLLSVLIMEGKSANKAWRQKMHQASGWGMLIVLSNLAYWYAVRRVYGDLSTLTVLIPLMLLVVPLLILKKTRQLKPTQGLDLIVEPVKRTVESEK